VCAVAPGHAAEAANEKEAREHFRVGVNYLQDIEGERYEEAYAEFKAAYALSHSPKVLGNVGLCAMKLERDGEAIEAYARYLGEVNDIAPDEKEQIVRDLETLRASAAKVTMTLESGPAMVLDTRVPTRGSPVRNAYGPVDGTLELTLRPGHHRIAVTVGGREVGVWELNLGASDRQSHEFRWTREAPRPSRGGAKTAPWILTGVGAAVLTAGGFMGLAALRKVDVVEKKCPNDACPPGSGFEQDVDAARSMVRATDVLLLTGAAIAGVGVTWLLVARDPPARGETGVAERRAEVAGACDGRGCRADLKVSF
jgi:hypothetical protein